MFVRYGIKIHFAHNTFKWNNEAKGNAAVHVVIIGFSNYDIPGKKLFNYQDVKGDPHGTMVKNISPYLIEGGDVFVGSRNKPISQVPAMIIGSKPADGGNLLMTDEEKREYVDAEPQGEKFIRPILSAKEFLNLAKRWCFWLIDADPTELKRCPILMERIAAVRSFRSQSTKVPTQRAAAIPTLFAEIRQPTSSYILVPRHSSENRTYIPFGFFPSDYVLSDSCNGVPNATPYHFGVISSLMHMAWVKHICGRIKSDFRYSGDLVYNNFPWPQNPTEKQRNMVETSAGKVIEIREQYANTSLANLYDPDVMPPALVKAHNELDRAVDSCYRSQPFPNEIKRLEYLFALYAEYTGGLFSEVGKRKKGSATS